jgi:hypothetical protein
MPAGGGLHGPGRLDVHPWRLSHVHRVQLLASETWLQLGHDTRVLRAGHVSDVTGTFFA